MASICSNRSPSPSAMACWRRFDSCPPGISWCTPGRSARAARTRRARTPFAAPPSTAPDRRPPQRQPGVVFGVRGRGDDGAQRRLAGGARQRRRRAVDRAGAGLPGRQVGRQLTARGVMGVHMHRQVEPAAQRTDQRGAAWRAQQPGHVLDRQHVRTGVDDLLGQLEVVVQRVQVLAGVGQVAGVAHRDFGDRRAGFAHRVDRRAHRLDIVQRVEDPVDVDPGRGGLVDERLGHRLRVRRVADGVAAAQQHLQADVGHRLPQRGQPLPRIFLQKPKRHIVSRAAPALDRQQLRRHPRDVRRDHQQAGGAHPGGQQRLVRVAEGGVGDTDGRRVPQPPREALRTQLRQPLLADPRRRCRSDRPPAACHAGTPSTGAARAAC